ncbi:MAG: family 20 glycosylhydrolase [bacterium]|nr:family 20 glycosylhydrolase [bacterium]
MSDRLDLLLPGPQTIRTREGLIQARQFHFATDRLPAALVRPAMDYLIDRCGALPAGESPSESSALEIRLDLVESLPGEGYELEIEPVGVRIAASGRRGLFYGAVTLRQWLSLHDWAGEGASVPAVAIRDRPDFARRGVLLDISRNKVPKMESLLRLVDLLAELKYNELQLYMEHTFAYPGHAAVWRDASPLTAEDVQQLDGYCRLRCVELVPNQNSFGHFHRWLTHARYRDLAECPEGVQHAFSDEVEPFSLCPTDPASVDLLRDLYGKLLPNFTSGRFHVGFDETFEIGRGRSRRACTENGLDRVYLQFLESVRGLAAEHNRRVQIWADMLIEHRALLPMIPDDVILCEWGYEAGHPFREDSALLAATDCEVYVCPGTSSWSSFAGRGRNALINLTEAAAAGVATGAAGYLVTDWGDRGHLQPLSASYLGFAAGAAFAWHRTEAKRRDAGDWARAIDRWLLDSPGCGLGEAALDLADAYTLTGATQKNGTAFFHLLMSPDDGLENPRYRGLSREGLAKARRTIRSAAAKAARADTQSIEGRRTRSELNWVADTLQLACAVGEARLDSPFSDLTGFPTETRTTLAAQCAELADRRAELWPERNRPGGLDDSLHLFKRLARRL